MDSVNKYSYTGEKTNEIVGGMAVKHSATTTTNSEKKSFGDVVKQRRLSQKRRGIVVFLAVCFGNCLLGAYGYTVGYFYVELLDRYNEGVVKTNLIGTLNASLTCFMAPFATVLMNRLTARVTMFSGALLISMGCFLSAFVENILGLIITFGLIAGTGNAVATLPSFVAPGFYFERSRHSVLSALLFFTGLGMLLSTPLGVWVIDVYGLHGAYLILSGIMLQVCVIATLCKPTHVELQLIKKFTDDSSETISSKNNYKGDSKRDKPSNKTKAIKKNAIRLWVSFVLFLFSTITSNMVFGTFNLHFPNYLMMVRGSTIHTKSVMTILGVGNTTGRAFATIILIRESKFGLYIHIASLLISGIAAIVYPFYDQHVQLHFVFAFLIGFTTGAPYGVISSIVLKIVGIQRLSNGMGIALLCCGIGILSGPVVSSSLCDSFGSYNMSFIVTGCANLAGGLCAVLTKLVLNNYQT